MISLTLFEREILDHRLEVPDAIADAIERDFDVVDESCRHLRYDTIHWVIRPIDRLVLEDAVSGSTYAAAASQGSHQLQSETRRSGPNLAKKISKLIGKDVDFPDH